MHGIPGVTVIVDRRRGERRRGGGTPTEERRRVDRRVRRPEWSGLGYVLVRFAPRELAPPGNASTGEPASDDEPPTSDSVGMARVVLPNNF